MLLGRFAPRPGFICAKDAVHVTVVSSERELGCALTSPQVPRLGRRFIHVSRPVRESIAASLSRTLAQSQRVCCRNLCLTLRAFRNLSHSGSGANRWARKSTKVRIFAESRGL